MFNLFNFFRPKPKAPGEEYLGGLLKIISREVVGNMTITHGICKKVVTEKDIKPMTKVMEEYLGLEIFISVDPDDRHKVKFVMVKR